MTVHMLPPESSVTVEYPNTAGVATHLANAVLSCTLGVGLKTLSRILDATPIAGRQLLWLTRAVDPIAAVLPDPAGIRRQVIAFPTFRAEWLRHRAAGDPQNPCDAAILYLHGGAFISCGLNTHRRMAAALGQSAGLPVFSVDYRQLPQAHVTDSLADAMTAYQYLLDEGYRPDRIIVAGDSAGGGLAFRLALEARDRGMPLPGGIVGLSPWADYGEDARADHPNIARDVYLPALGAAALPRVGFAVDGALDPLWSPVNHDFTGLPPVLIQVGSTECLLPDAEALARRCAEADVPAVLQIWDRAAHVFQIAFEVLPDARAALEAVAAFSRAVVEEGAEAQTSVA